MTLATKITLLRIVCIPLFIYSFFHGHLYFQWHLWISAVLFLSIALTDALDGYLARRYQEVTNIVKFLKSLADKLLVSAGLLCLLEVGKITSMPVFIIVAREFAISGLRSLALLQSQTSIAASGLAKIKTVAQVALVIVLILQIRIPIFESYDQWLIWLTVGITVASAIDYISKYRRLFF